VIAKAPENGKRGTNTTGLLRYLFGPGQANEHSNPHLVAAWDPEWLEGGVFAELIGQRGGLVKLGREIDAAMTGHEVQVPGGHVYHVALSVPPADSNPGKGFFGDTLWRELVESAIAHMGFGPDAAGRGGCRWVAVHHGLSTEGNDHVHLVLNLVQSDGRIANTYRDWPRWRAWCRTVEERWSLTRTGVSDGTATPRPTRAESEKARRLEQRVPARDRLRRTSSLAAVASASFDEFRDQLAAYQVRMRIRHDRDGRPVGYAVTDEHNPDCRTAAGESVYFGGATLAPELSLPKLQQRWDSTDSHQPEQPRPQAAASAVQRASRAILNASDSGKLGSRFVQEGAEGVAQATGDLLLGLCRAVEPEQRSALLQSWEAYAQAARVPRRIVPNRWNRAARDMHVLTRRLIGASAHSRSTDTATVADVAALVLAVASLIAEVAAWQEMRNNTAAARHANHAAQLLTTAAAAAIGSPANVRPGRAATNKSVPPQRHQNPMPRHIAAVPGLGTRSRTR
jgi:hypothetical protein